MAEDNPKTTPPEGPVYGGRYQPIRLLARGSMGNVYQAVDLSTELSVALKVLHPHLTDRDSTAERLMREARAASTIGHPGVVACFDEGRTDDGGFYLVMELLRGTSLRNWLADRQDQKVLPEAVAALKGMLAPLAAAHTAGVIHRDIKPDNVFVIGASRGGAEPLPEPPEIKLIDFGIARDDLSGPATKTGLTMGTPHYMSPEQAMDPRKCTPASDVWSVGVMLYEILTGKLPFEGETLPAVCMAAYQTPHVPVTTHAPEVDPALAAVVDRCLEKKPAHRFPHAGAVLSALEGVSDAGMASISGISLNPVFGADESGEGPISLSEIEPISTGSGDGRGAALVLPPDSDTLAQAPTLDADGVLDESIDEEIDGFPHRFVRWGGIAVLLLMLGGVGWAVLAHEDDEGPGGDTDPSRAMVAVTEVQPDGAIKAAAEMPDVHVSDAAVPDAVMPDAVMPDAATQVAEQPKPKPLRRRARRGVTRRGAKRTRVEPAVKGEVPAQPAMPAAVEVEKDPLTEVAPVVPQLQAPEQPESDIAPEIPAAPDAAVPPVVEVKAPTPETAPAAPEQPAASDVPPAPEAPPAPPPVKEEKKEQPQPFVTF
ncbi:MAG: protein kinase domain-containing protein [Bradymonadia bacterium]